MSAAPRSSLKPAGPGARQRKKIPASIKVLAAGASAGTPVPVLIRRPGSVTVAELDAGMHTNDECVIAFGFFDLRFFVYIYVIDLNN